MPPMARRLTDSGTFRRRHSLVGKVGADLRQDCAVGEGRHDNRQCH